MTAARLRKASPRLTIDVTKDIIETATARDSSHCMIADAIQQQVPNARYISVDLATVRFSDLTAGVRYIYLTPRGAQAALLDFDQGKKPEPFTIRLDNAHMLATGSAQKARARLEPQSRGNTPPERRGGKSAPLGPLPGGAPQNRRDPRPENPAAGAGNRTGRRREFGLRAIIR